MKVARPSKFQLQNLIGEDFLVPIQYHYKLRKQFS